MSKLLVVPILNDNYVWILRSNNNYCIIVDPGDYNPILLTIKKYNLIPSYVLVTHCHLDHVLGIKKLLKKFPNLKIYGPKESKKYGIKKILYGGEYLNILENQCYVMDTPGHTLGHLSYYIPPYLFCGDTLFSAGCGKIFNKNYELMFNSIKKISNLPNKTILCYSHEYTICNLKFFLKILNYNDKKIYNYYLLIKSLRKKNIFLLNTLENEKKINYFLTLALNIKTKNINVKNKLFNYFVYLRKKKDKFICQ